MLQTVLMPSLATGVFYRDGSVNLLAPMPLCSVAVGLSLLLILAGCDAGGAAPVVPLLLEDVQLPAVPEETQRQIGRFCGDCHALPRPQSFDRDRWHFEVRRGYEFYAKSGRNDLVVPPLEATLRWFRSQAPAQLTFPEAAEADGAVPVHFDTEAIPLDLGVGVGVTPEIADLVWGQLADDEEPMLLASDLRHGQIMAIDLHRQNRVAPMVLARMRNPGRLEICDLDDDGLKEVVVADLGSYLPAEHDRGRVMLLRREAPSDTFETVELLTDLARVADVQVADLDGDLPQGSDRGGVRLEGYRTAAVGSKCLDTRAAGV